MTHTIDGQMGTLRYIADSPPEVHGGFAAQTVAAAKWALAEIERLQAELSELHAKDSVRTKEHNVLVQENRSVHAENNALRSENIRANGKLMAENERLREQRPLTDEEKTWVEKAWQEYRNAEKPAGKDTSLFANMLGRDA